MSDITAALHKELQDAIDTGNYLGISYIVVGNGGRFRTLNLPRRNATHARK